MKEFRRSSGILMPVFSLPSPYGIGTMGQEARKFVDFLAEAKQSYWQILPVGPTGFGDSPYQSFSSFAGNPYLIDLDQLVEDGLLYEEEIAHIRWGQKAGRIDYRALYENRFRVLRIAANRGRERDRSDFEAFYEENERWLSEYALFMAVKNHFGGKPWTEWPDIAIRFHERKSCENYREMLASEVEFYSYIQYLFFRQWQALRDYAREAGIRILGDLPIYVAMDSADVWSEPEWFRLDERNVPLEVAGVPPDYFTAEGQLWGNPLYDWDRMKEDGFGWWIRRVDGASRLYDVLRIDHFRGFESYWAVPYGDTTAKNGHWVKGPGMDVIGVLEDWFPEITFIAEDLGYLTPEVRQLLEDSGLPGMKVLQFAFDSREAANYLPHTYGRHCVCYTGTHDNLPITQWEKEADSDDVDSAVRYLGLNDEEGFCWGFIRGGMSSVANLFIAQMQDYLGLAGGSRVNEPGSFGSNWQWRMERGADDEELARRIAAVTEMYGR